MTPRARGRPLPDRRRGVPLGRSSSGPWHQWPQGEPDGPSSCQLGSANELPASLSRFRSRPGDGLSRPPLHVPVLCTPVCTGSHSAEAPSHSSLNGQPLLTLQPQPACHLGEAFPGSLSSRQASFSLCRVSVDFLHGLFTDIILSLPAIPPVTRCEFPERGLCFCWSLPVPSVPRT